MRKKCTTSEYMKSTEMIHTIKCLYTSECKLISALKRNISVNITLDKHKEKDFALLPLKRYHFFSSSNFYTSAEFENKHFTINENSLCLLVME